MARKFVFHGIKVKSHMLYDHLLDHHKLVLTHSRVENQSCWPNPCYNRHLEMFFCALGFHKIPEFLFLLQRSLMMVMFQMEILTF